jgi:hypothetical protein
MSRNEVGIIVPTVVGGEPVTIEGALIVMASASRAWG